jgi:plastocyanin
MSTKAKAPALPASIKSVLQKAKTAWKDAAKAAKEAPGFKELPDGRYNARLSTAEIVESNNKRPMIKWSFVVTEPEEFVGDTINRFSMMDGENSWEYIAKDLLRLGVDVEGFDVMELPAVLLGLAEETPLVSLRLRTKNGSDYQNVDFIGLVDDEGEESEEEEDEDDSDDDTEDEDGDTVEIEVGTEVSFSLKNKAYEGAIASIDEDAGTVKVKCSDGKTRTVSFDDLTIIASQDEDEEEEEEEDESEDEESEEEEEDEAELEVGSTVRYPWKGELAEGKVKSIHEEAGVAKVVTDGKVRSIEFDQLQLVLTADEDEEEEEEDDTPPAPPAKKPTSRKK